LIYSIISSAQICTQISDISIIDRVMAIFIMSSGQKQAMSVIFGKFISIINWYSHFKKNVLNASHLPGN